MTETPAAGASAAPSSRDKILDVGEALFARRGYAGVGLREVAEAAGLGKSSLFHHFKGKAQLYCEVLSRVLLRIQERLAPVLASDAGAAARLERSLETLVDALAEHPTTARLLLRGLFEDDDFDLEALPEARATERILAGILESFHALLREGVAAGEFREVSVPHTLQTLIGAIVYHFASGELGEGLLGRPVFSAEEVRRRKRELVAFLRHGIHAPRASTRPGENE